MGKFTISMAMFNSYFDITRGYFLGAKRWDQQWGSDLNWRESNAKMRGVPQEECHPPREAQK